MVLFSQSIRVLDLEYEVVGISTISNLKDNTLVFIQKKYESSIKNLDKVKGCCVVAENGIDIPSELKLIHNFILTDNPRLLFTKIYIQLVKKIEEGNRIRIYSNINGAMIGENVRLGKGVIIEPFCFIDHDVTIGDNTIIKSGSKIRSRVTIGKQCLIKENAVIGSSGFNFERDDDGSLLGTPQLGGVTINDSVEIGAFVTVASGTIDDTIINNQVKINDHAHIAHNVQIGECTIIGAATTISGSTKIGKNVWIAPNCTIMNQITIGNQSVIGLSARVCKSVPNGTTIINENGEPIEKVLEFIKYKKGLMEEVPMITDRNVGRGHPFFK